MNLRTPFLLAVIAAFILSLSSSPSRAQSQCDQIPALKIWGGMTNVRVERYIVSKHEGDWQPYVDHLAKQLANIKKIQKSGKTAQVRYKGKVIRLSGDRLDAYVSASAKRHQVINCLAEEALEQDMENLDNFSTAAGGSDESDEVEVPTVNARVSVQKANVKADVLRLKVATSCENGSSVFKITNAGENWPKSSIFAIYRLSGETKQVISSRRMRLKGNQTSSFRIKASKNPTGELGLFIDPSWYKRKFAYDAVARCR